MSIILYEDDEWLVEGLILPPYASIQEDIGTDIKYSVSIPPRGNNEVKTIKDWILNRNSLLTMNNNRNINGKLVGDYTCCASLNGKEIKALITMSSTSDSNTRHTRDGVWQNEGATLSFSIEEVV